MNRSASGYRAKITPVSDKLPMPPGCQEHGSDFAPIEWGCLMHEAVSTTDHRVVYESWIRSELDQTRSRPEAALVV